MVVKVLQWLNIPTGVTEEVSGAEEQLVTSPSGQSSYNTLEKGEESLQENLLTSRGASTKVYWLMSLTKQKCTFSQILL